MSSIQTQMRDGNMGANGLQPYQDTFRVTLLSSSQSHESISPAGHYHFDEPRGSGYWQQQAVGATPTANDKILRAPRYHDPSCNRPNQKDHVQSGHLVPQTDVYKHGTLVRMNQQNFRLNSDGNNASGPERRQKADGDTGPSKPCEKDVPEGRTQARDPGEGAAAVASLGAQPNGCQPPCTPPMLPIPLPGRQKDGENESVRYGYGRKLSTGSWFTSTVKVDNDNLLSHLDMSLPVPFT